MTGTKRTLLPLLACLCTVLAASCSSVDLPSIRESDKAIARYRPLIEQNDKAINAAATTLPAGNDIILRIDKQALNRIMLAIAGQRSDDVRITFPPTRPLMKEDKSILGISYTNAIDIDTGNLVMDLSVLRFDRFKGNAIEASIGVEGKGKLSVSGRYTGIPASASPEIEMKLNETIAFDVGRADSGFIILRPRKQTLHLHTKFFVKIIEWQIPWSKDVPLEETDLIPPLKIPMSFATSLPFPVPSPTYGDERMTFVPHAVQFLRTLINATNDNLEIRTDFTFK
jgi:hypothetical protein